MPEFEFEFSQQDKELVVSQDASTFEGTDYIRLTIYPKESLGNIVVLPNTDSQAIFFSSLNAQEFDINISPFSAGGLDEITTKTIGGNVNNGKGGDFKIYKNGDDIFIKPNDIFDEFGLPQGNYTIQIDFLNQVNPTSISQTADDGVEDDPGSDVETQQQFYNFIVKQISTSRKEVRLKLIDKNITNDSQIITDLTNEFNNNFLTDDGFTNPPFLQDDVIESDTFGQFVIPNQNYKYQFKHVLNIGTGDHNPIMNYTFDRITNGRDNQSIILKLYDPLPISITNLSMVTIEREVITTQVQEIFYFSDVPDVFFGDGLNSDKTEDYINDDDDVGFQNFNQLSASIDETTLDSLVSQSIYDYPNLNTNFNEFENHTFFGSAKNKLENFKKKVETIQGYYSEISSSLVVSSSITGDSTFIIEYRKNLFNKIRKEFNTFTPYERFLYYDGQSETTASAPGLGKNYADTIPVTLSGEGIVLESHNGFKNVYKHSSEKVSGTHNEFIDLFTDKYHIHKKPFFNYSGSVYLSFLMQGDSGSDLRYNNNNNQIHNGLNNTLLPQDTKFQNNILNPDMTGSAYQRYIFEASMSYFAPIVTINNPSTNDITDFGAGSTDIEILNGVKTGSLSPIKAYGEYSNLATQKVEPGVPFTGSIMPAGELFRINYINSLSSSLQGYMNFDSQTSGSDVTDDMMLSASAEGSGTLDNPGPAGSGTSPFSSVRIADGVEIHGRKYGQSVQFVSESRHELDFDDDKFNFNKDTLGFSLSIWAKRFHPNTGSADAAGQHNPNSNQGIFVRGQTANSYGITFNQNTPSISAGVRGAAYGPSNIATQRSVTSTVPGDAHMTQSWHHLVLTFESGSTDGIKFYIDNDLKGTQSTLAHEGYLITGSNDFSASNYATEPLTVGGNDILGGNTVFYNGFLQYPRVYDRTITATEVNSLYLNPPGITETKITDVKVTFKNPTDVLPFDTIYKTTSTEFTDWYNDALTKAETFDNNNIHSLENNLPLYIQNSSDFNDMKKFLNLQSEQYDLIRNHIDSLGTFNDRGYKQTNSPPNNTLPMLLSNMGYQAINPFSSSLTDSLSPYLSNITSIDDIKNDTWRKTLNNLIYIYKSKGTLNSVRALLNVYGYPPDIISFNEFGGSTNDLVQGTDIDSGEVINPVFSNSPPPPILNQTQQEDVNLNNASGVFSFTTKKERLGYYNFNKDDNRVINLNWWMDDANANTIEFVYKHVKTDETQTILESSGSATQTLWDLQLIPSANPSSASFKFRLNDSQTADNAIGGRSFSMSLAYIPIQDGQFVNVMLQRMTGSEVGDGAGIQEYRLHAALQDDKIIKSYAYVTMSISGGLQGSSTLGGKGFFANQNFMGTGSRHPLSSSNLVVGKSISGSLAQIKAWSTALSTSKFRQRVFNKLSTVGNTINSHKDELIYNFKLNESYASSSISSSAQTFTIKDSSPKTSFRDYSFEKQSSIFTTSSIYSSDIINTVRFSLSDSSKLENNKTTFINPPRKVISDLNSKKSAVKSLINPIGEKSKIKVSKKLEIFRSPQTFVDNFILDNISTFNLEKLYGNPMFYYSSSYDDLETFRKEFFDVNDIRVDINKFVRAHENMFNNSIVEGLKSIVPGGSSFSDKNSNIGVEIKPTILEKQKYENKKATLVVNPNTFSSSITPSPSVLPTIEFEKSGSVSVLPSYNDSLVLLPKSGSVSVLPTYDGSNLVLPKSASLSLLPTYDGSTIVLPISGTNNFIATNYNKSFRNIHSDWGTGSNDTYFVSYLPSDSGSDGEYNIRHIEPRFVFHTIMDTELYSGSFGKESDYTNQSFFHNRVMLTEGIHANITYDSFIGGIPGTQTGRMIGKTKYFITGSNGEITLPANHVSRYVDHYLVNMTKGTKNVNPGILNVQAEDYSTSSFYSVEVTPGEREIIVKSGKGSVDSNNRIQY